MSFDEKFKVQISDFERYGTFTYQFDEVGNVVFNSSSADFSEVYLALPLTNFVYDTSKIAGFYDPTFTEFVPASDTTPVAANVEQIQSDLETAQSQNLELAKQLDDLISQNESDSTAAQSEAAKQVILELRKSLGQGRVDTDFSTDFPYSPVRKEPNISDS